MDPEFHNLLKKIATFIADIDACYSGKIREVVISKISKEQLKEAKEALGFKCSSTNLGYFAFMIKYTIDGKTTRYTVGTAP